MNLNEEHRTELIRGLASAALLAGLLVGLPILLIVGVGWPLPQEIPSGSEVANALKTGAIPPSLILKSISLVVWVLWLQMLAGVAIELWAHLHGRVAPRVAFVPLFVQRLSARIIGTALVIAFSIQHPGIAMADNQDLLAPASTETEVGQSWEVAFEDAEGRFAPVANRSEANATLGEEPTDAEPLIHTVGRRDSLRMLAERYLGDPSRWNEVFVLNQDQPQAVGGTLTDPARLQPGWELVMPADTHQELAVFDDKKAPVNSPPTLVPLPEPDGSTITVQSGDTLWGLATHHLHDPERWIDIFNSNRDIIQDPSVIMPGWQLQLPAHEPEIQMPPSTDPPSKPLPVSTGRPAPVMAYSAARPTVVTSVIPAETEGQPDSGRQTVIAIGGLGVFASSLGWVLARLRRTHRRSLPNLRIPASPSAEAVHVQQQLEAAFDPDSALFLDASLRVLSSRVLGTPPLEIIGVSLDSHSVSVLLGTPAEAPSGFVVGEDGMTWRLSRDVELEHLLAEADGVPAPLPALVTVGKRGGHEFLLNLEYIDALNLEGDSEAVGDMCAAMATQLASSHLADDLTVLCVGFGQALTAFERVDYVSDVTSAIERIEYQRSQNRALLGSHPPPAITRFGSSGDFWHPTVVLVSNALQEEEASRLLEVCGSSVSIVAHGLQGANWKGYFDERGLLLEPIGLQLEPLGLSGDAVAAVAELAVCAKEIQGVSPAVATSIPPNGGPPLIDPLPVDLEVRAMGTVDVLGAAHQFKSRRALDLVAYLAFHPEGADADQITANIWPPDKPPSRSTLANTVSRARKGLGLNDDGEHYLPRVGPRGIYRLRPEVGTDVGRFKDLVSAARLDPSERGREMLQTALELVRGAPFTGGTGDMYRWADFGLRTQIDCLVDTTAHELAERCIEAGDTQGARMAALTSLQVVGVCEQCYRWRLMAAAESPTEIRHVMVELVELLRRESKQPEADDLVSPDLMELYDQLMSSRAVFS